MSDPVSDLKRELVAAAERQRLRGVAVRTSRPAGLEGATVHRGRHRLLLAVAAAFVVAVGAASAIGDVRDVIFGERFPGLPPVGAKPSAPQRGELVATWQGFSAALTPGKGEPLVRAWLYADGRLIWDRPSHAERSQLTSGLVEQRLSPEGVALVRSAIAALFRRSSRLVEKVPSDADRPTGRRALFVPPDYPSGWGSVEARKGDQVVRLQWRGGGLRETYVGAMAMPQQLSDLRRVDALFTDPASVLPSSAWADREARTYVASHYAVCITPSLPKKMPLSRLLPLLPPRVADLLRGTSRTGSANDYGYGAPASYCSKLTTAEARTVGKALSGRRRAPGSRGGIGPVYRVAGAGATTIWLAPYFPDGQFIYAGGYG